jgi:uncharacterized cupin superfamily protein
MCVLRGTKVFRSGMDKAQPIAVLASDVPLRTKPSNYPEPFASMVVGREKRPLGDLFGLANFGVNFTRLMPGAISALRHAHSAQDEFVFILSGEPTLVSNAGETLLSPGMCAGFKAGNNDGHHLINKTDKEVVYIEIGDRSPGDSVFYPDDDIQAVVGKDGKWQFQRKDGSAY